MWLSILSLDLSVQSGSLGKLGKVGQVNSSMAGDGLNFVACKNGCLGCSWARALSVDDQYFFQMEFVFCIYINLYASV